MLQKMIVGFLMLTVVGAAGVGVYDSTRSSSAAEANPFLSSSDPMVAPVEQAAPEMLMAATPTVEPAAADTATDPSITSQQPVQQQQQQAVDMVGDPWMAQGTIVSFATAGMTLEIADGTQIFVELGPSHYWQAQDVALAVGETVTVDGFYNGDQYHAATITKTDGAQLMVRTADGLPLWSGGASTTQTNGNGQGGSTDTVQGNNGQGGNGQGGNSTGQTQVAAEDWITLEATVVAQDVNGLTVETPAGEIFTFQLGQASFVDGQAVTFAAGDELEIKGFWQGTTFRAGEIIKLATGERLMLLDPNGRPLWGGPGRAGNSGQGSTGQGSSNGQGGGNGQGGQGGGNGKGYRGGRQ